LALLIERDANINFQAKDGYANMFAVW